MLLLHPGEVPYTYADVNDLAEQFDFRPVNPVAQGVTNFVAWYRDLLRV